MTVLILAGDININNEVALWNSEDARVEGFRLVAEGVHRTSPNKFLALYSCTVPSGTKAEIVSYDSEARNGLGLGTVRITEGQHSGCTGTVTREQMTPVSDANQVGRPSAAAPAATNGLNLPPGFAVTGQPSKREVGPAAEGTNQIPQQPLPLAQTGKSMPPEEEHFIDAVKDGRQQYEAATNEMRQGATRPARAKAICAAVNSPNIKGWISTVNALSTNSEGRGVIEIMVAEDVRIKTWSNSFSDMFGKTLIEPGTPLYESLMDLKVGDRVSFDGTFLQDKTDCFEEKSMTMRGSMTDPEFLMRFSRIVALGPAGAP